MNVEVLDKLNAAFSIDGQVRVINRDGHGIIIIKTSEAEAEVALQGAQPLSWTPVGHRDVFWCAPLPPAESGKAIRGGIPICWPWFGPHATDASQPQHGLVRTLDWAISKTAITSDSVHLSLTQTAFGCALQVDLRISTTFSMALTARNTSAAPVTITEALHTYFHVADVAAAEVHGLDGLTYRDNRDGGREKRQHGAIAAQEEVVSVFPATPDVATIEDPGLRRRIQIARAGGRSTIVWHPGATVQGFKDIPPERARNFICVESGNVAPHAVTIAPGASHTMSVTYTVEGF